MATQYTSSTSSGYATDVSWGVMNNRRYFMCHYSAPNAATGYVNVGFPTIGHVYVQDADPTTYAYATDSVGGVSVYFSGLVTGNTGYMFIVS